MGIRDAIRKAKDLPLKKVAVPHWGVDVYVRPLTSTDYARIDALSKGDDSRRAVCVVCLATLDEKGERVFSDGDVEMLEGKSGAAILAIAQAVIELSKPETPIA